VVSVLLVLIEVKHYNLRTKPACVSSPWLISVRFHGIE